MQHTIARRSAKSSAMRMVALALGVILFTAACSAPSDSPAGGDAKPVESVTLSGPNPVLTLDATAAGEIASLLAIYLGQGQLFRFDADQNPVPDLAKSAELSQDGLEMTITLRDDAKYSDGSPVRAVDIKTAFDRQKKGAVASYLTSMDSVEVVDDKVAIIHLNATDPDVIRWLTGRALPLNPTDKVTNDPKYFEHPVSAGPYVVKDWTPGQSQLVLVENESYVAGPMMAKTVTIVGVPDIASRVLQVSSGAIDFAWDIPLASASSLPSTVSATAGPIGGYNYLAVNMAKDTPFADPNVRRAMSLALDRAEISERAFFGQAPAATSFMYSCGDLCESGLLPNAGKLDLNGAKSLMAKAGYGTERVSAEMLVSSSRPGWSDAALVISEQLRKIGIDLEVAPVDEATWIDAVTKSNFDVMFSGGAAPAQGALQQIFASDGWWATGVGYKNDETTKLVAEAGRTRDLAERTALFSKIQKIGQETMPMITVLERVELVASTTPDGLLVRPLNSQLVNVQTVAQAKAGLRAGEHDK